MNIVQFPLALILSYQLKTLHGNMELLLQEQYDERELYCHQPAIKIVKQKPVI